MFPKPYPWQSQQWDHLLARMANDTLPHALLLGGPEGVGKLDFAKAMAARLLCNEKRQEKSEERIPVLDTGPTPTTLRTPFFNGDSTHRLACGQCQSCLWLAAGSHPDYQIIQPEEEGKAIKIEAIRELIAFVSQTAQTVRKMIVLSPAEAMNTASANALLKMLEEPPPEVVFLLVSHQPGMLFPTIRSRCQLVSFSAPSLDLSLPWLETHLTSGISPNLLLALAEKLPLRALALSEKTKWEAYQNWVSGFFQFNQQRINLIEMATMSVNMQDDEALFNGLYLLMKDILWLQYTQNIPNKGTDFLSHSNHLENLLSLSQKINTTKLFSFLDHVIHFRKQLQLKIALNKNLLWESIFIQWLSVMPPNPR